MNRETKRPRITRPIENRDENRRSRTPRFENREGGESHEVLQIGELQETGRNIA